MKSIYLLFSFLSLGYLSQAQTLDDFNVEDLNFSFGGQTSANFLSAPVLNNSYQSNALDESLPAEWLYEPLQSYSGGISLQWQIDPIEHEYLHYRFAQEWSYGVGWGTSYHYKLSGHEVAVGPSIIQFVYHSKDRLLNVLGETQPVDESFQIHRVRFSEIQRQVFGLRTQIEDEGTIMLGLVQESIADRPNLEAWTGAMFRLEYPEGWGFEAVLFWAHPAEGELFFDLNQFPQENEPENTGFLLNLKLNYRFAYRANYAEVLGF